MNPSRRAIVPLALVTALALGAALDAGADEAAAFFDDSVVGEVCLTFTDPDWYTTLYDSHANDPDDPYFPATFEANGVVLGPVGVRFKGSSSFSIPGVKKSFKIDFSEYDDTVTFLGLAKLNLNNGFKDPTMLREKLFLDFAAQFVPTIRAAHVRVYVNGTYWGLYTAVEQVDETFVQSRFGYDEAGNLFKGAASDDVTGPASDFGSDLTWLGSDPTPYYDSYQLKTNETENDYSQLITLIDVLNNQSPADFPTLLEPLLDVQNALTSLALDNLFVNLDSYLASAHNFYLYDRDDSGRFTHVFWDTNESFGRFLMGLGPSENPLELDPFWLPGPTGPPPGVPQERPLMENLWANADYANDYLCAMQRMLDEGFDATTMQQRIDELADLIRTDLYADPNKMYTNAQFEQNLQSDITDGPDTVYGLLHLVQQRAPYLAGRLATTTLDCPAAPSDLVGTLFVNELMADNATTIEDPAEPGAFEDWFEIYNASSSPVDLGGLYLTDDLASPTTWQVPLGVTIAANGHLLIWADDEETQGSTHAGFKLGASGEAIGLFDRDGSSLVDSVVFGAQYADVAYGRSPDGGDNWGFMAAPTPAAANGPHNATPVISGTAHTPAWPTSADEVRVTATVTDDGAVAAVTLTFDAGGGPSDLPMMDDGASGDGAAGDGTYGALVPAQPTATIVRYYLSATDTLGATATDPASAPTVTHSYVVGYVRKALFVNELMADNDATVEDPDEPGAFEDWVELHNAGTTTVDLGGMYMSDDPDVPTAWQVPAGVTIAPGSFLIVWCDDDVAQGATHASFKLSAAGEQVGLYESDANGNVAVDAVTFGAQSTDVSLGRCPDGGGCWEIMGVATPGASNSCAALVFGDGFETGGTTAWSSSVP